MAEPHPIALLVEDDKQIRCLVRRVLENQGWIVHEADTVARGLSEAGARVLDLVLLDLGLPDGDGTHFLRELRGWSDVAVIVVTGRASERDKIDVLDAGADDYLTKPFGVGELLARVRAASRRRRGSSEELPSIIEFGDISINFTSRTVQKGGRPIHLTPTEYRVLCLLAANEGKVLTYLKIMTEICGLDRPRAEHYLRVYMRNLRHKLEDEPARPQHILTEPAVGYRLVQKPQH
jgi:two-component system, OmpR family, KDP operon response regulator KdpE